MPKYTYDVVVDAEDGEEADIIMKKRMDPDLDCGFSHKVEHYFTN